MMHSLRDYDAEKSAGRMAVQAAAGALMSVTGHTCEDIVMCSTAREWDDVLEVQCPSQQPSYLQMGRFHSCVQYAASDNTPCL